MWNNWFTVNEIIKRNSIVLATANENTHSTENQPIEAKVTTGSELQLRAQLSAKVNNRHLKKNLKPFFTRPKVSECESRSED